MAKLTDLPATLHPGLAEALTGAGIEYLYSHQAEAYETARDSDLILTSGTASGKSLSFNLPVLDGIAHEPKRRALYRIRPRRSPRTRLESSASCDPPACARRPTTATPRARSGPRSAARPTWF